MKCLCLDYCKIICSGDGTPRVEAGPTWPAGLEDDIVRKLGSESCKPDTNGLLNLSGERILGTVINSRFVICHMRTVETQQVGEARKQSSGHVSAAAWSASTDALMEVASGRMAAVAARLVGGQGVNDGPQVILRPDDPGFPYPRFCPSVEDAAFSAALAAVGRGTGDINLIVRQKDWNILDFIDCLTICLPQNRRLKISFDTAPVVLPTNMSIVRIHPECSQSWLAGSATILSEVETRLMLERSSTEVVTGDDWLTRCALDGRLDSVDRYQIVREVCRGGTRSDVIRELGSCLPEVGARVWQDERSILIKLLEEDDGTLLGLLSTWLVDEDFARIAEAPRSMGTVLRTGGPEVMERLGRWLCRSEAADDYVGMILQSPSAWSCYLAGCEEHGGGDRMVRALALLGSSPLPGLLDELLTAVLKKTDRGSETEPWMKRFNAILTELPAFHDRRVEQKRLLTMLYTGSGEDTLDRLCGLMPMDLGNPDDNWRGIQGVLSRVVHLSDEEKIFKRIETCLAFSKEQARLLCSVIEAVCEVNVKQRVRRRVLERIALRWVYMFVPEQDQHIVTAKVGPVLAASGRFGARLKEFWDGVTKG